MSNAESGNFTSRQEAMRVAIREMAKAQRSRVTRAELLQEAIRLSGRAFDAPGAVPRPIYQKVANAFARARWRRGAGQPDRGLEAILKPYSARRGGMTVADCARLFIELSGREAAGESAAGQMVSARAAAPAGARIADVEGRRGSAARYVLRRSGSTSREARKLDLATGLDVLGRQGVAAGKLRDGLAEPASDAQDGRAIRDAARHGSAAVEAGRQLKRVEGLVGIVDAAREHAPGRGTAQATMVRDARAMLRQIAMRGLPLGSGMVRLGSVNPQLAQRVEAVLGV